MNRLKKGDQVYIISGKDKGKLGTIAEIMKNDKILVDGINLAKKHVKPNPNKNETGGIVEKEMPIHLSNVMIWNSATKKHDKVAFKKEKEKKIRFFRSSSKEIK